MRRAEFLSLTNDLEAAHKAWSEFLANLGRNASGDRVSFGHAELERARVLKGRVEEIEAKWFPVARGAEPLTD